VIDFDGIRAANPVADVVSKYLELVRAGSEYKARCPFHDERTPSFYVNPRKSKAFCMGCGWHGDAIDFVAEYENISLAEAAAKLGGGQLPTERPAPAPLPPDASSDWTPILPVPDDAPDYDPARTFNPKRGKTVAYRPVATWAYRDPAGRLLGYVIRFEIDGQKLTPTITYCQHVDGTRRWCARPFPTPRPLYGLQALAERPAAPVVLGEGEKARDAAAQGLPGMVCVTWPGGSNGVRWADFSPLAGKDVVLWPDADDAGLKAMREIAEKLTALGVKRIRWIDTEGLAKGFDAADVPAGEMVAFCRARVREVPPAGPEPPSNDVEKKSGQAGEGSTTDGGAPAAAASPAASRQDTGQGRGVATLDDSATANSTTETRAVATFQPENEPENGQLSSSTYSPPFFEDVEVLPVRVRAELDATLDPANDDLPDLYSEDNAALAFSRNFADDLRYVAPWGRWMLWRDQRWLHEDTLQVFDYARKVCRSVAAIAQNDPSLTPAQKKTVSSRYGLASTVASIERLARADRRHAATIEQWDADPWLLNTPAGVVDLRTGQVRPGDRGAHMTKITHVAPGGACPDWLRFLDTATAGDRDLIGFLQRMAGYCLTGSTRDHALFFVYGTGGNGKGTFLNTLQWIMGDYAKAAPADMFTERKHEAHTTELARLMGARLVAAQETEEGKRWAEAKIKALTGGDPITARFMRQDDFEYIPQFKLVMTGNHKPGLRNVDEAIKRRLHLIPFTVTIPAEKRDTGLAERLKAEAGGILAWAIEGCRQWQARGLAAPAAVLAATDEYMDQQDVLGLWLDEACELGKGYSWRRGDLYKSFKAWAEGAGEYVLPQKRWVAAMETRGYKAGLRDGIQYLTGVRLRADQVPDRFSDRY
jgi:P4 family phage/plasmid primase-like protien